MKYKVIELCNCEVEVRQRLDLKTRPGAGSQDGRAADRGSPAPLSGSPEARAPVCTASEDYEQGWELTKVID